MSLLLKTAIKKINLNGVKQAEMECYSGETGP
jgi:hypothetical protein